jgi:hypothetical protein
VSFRRYERIIREFVGMCKTTEEGPLDDAPPDSAESREADLRPYFGTD